MEGRIADLITAPFPRAKRARENIFGPKFQSMDGFRSFLRIYLCLGSVSHTLNQGLAQWSVESFQALYIACWIHHPVEKGTFLIDLNALSSGARKNLRDAYEEALAERAGFLHPASSHLSKKGRSAAKGFNFLKGYRELLVQIEELGGRSYLMLKAEGHTTGLAGIVPHGISYLQKKATGAGNTANKHLNAFANLSEEVEGRAAENYGVGYEKILKFLGLEDKFTTVRELLYELFKKVGYPLNATLDYHYFDQATNKELGHLLTRYISDAKKNIKLRSLSNWYSRVQVDKTASKLPLIGHSASGGSYVTDKALKDLLSVAMTLEKDGDVVEYRIYQEVRVTPAELDDSLNYFLSRTDYSGLLPNELKTVAGLEGGKIQRNLRRERV